LATGYTIVLPQASHHLRPQNKAPIKGIQPVFKPTRSLKLALSLTTAMSFAGAAFAQDASTATPPARVGQVADVSGSVSYNGAGSNGQWVAATENYPVSAGDSLFTQNGAQAALVLNASRLTLGPNTELQVTTLDAQNFSATTSQGEVFLNLTDLQPGQTFTLNTPRGPVSIESDGEYDIAAGDANDPTTVAVLSGAASIGQLQVPAGQEGYLSGTDQTTAQLGALQRDDFMNQELADMAPPPPPYAPPVVEQMTGVSELSSYGDWNQDPQYGAVWYPNVGPGWAPYHEGHWAFIAPWGWTWVDNEPWGFAPFHYGRWIQDEGRWGWVPAGAYGGGYGPDYQPVYAPAVVSFFGVGAGVAITASFFASGSVGWVPLAPGEAYYPPYHVDRDYIQRINRVDVHNYTQINIHNTTIINNYANRRAAIYVPASAMTHGDPVGHYGHAMPADMFAKARPIEAGGGFNQALRPAYQPRAAEPPHLTDFAERRDVPAPVMSHAPAPFHENDMGQMRPEASTGPFHPEAAQGYNPQAEPAAHAQAPEVHYGAAPTPEYRPQEAPAYHPQMEQPQYHAPSAPAYRPEAAAPAYRPEAPMQQYHPESAPAYHPQPEQQFRPEMAPRPEQAPRPEESRPEKHQP